MPESQLDHKQLLAYAEDLAKIYESEKQKRTLLEIENQKLRLTIDGLSDAVVSLDRQQNILEANQPFATLMETELSEMAGTAMSDALPGAGWQPILDGIGEMTVSDELELTPSQDRQRMFRVFRNPVIDAAGERYGWIIIIRDETQVRRTAILKDEFLSIVSHEIRTPMNAIIGFSNFLEKSLKDRLEESELKYFDIIRNSTERLLSTLQEMIDAAELATEIPDERSEFDLCGLISDIKAKYEPLLQGKDLRMAVSTPNEPTLGWGYPELMMKAVDHLIGNALEFSPANTEIAVELTDDKEHWQLTVRDHGEGIPPERLEHIFDAFYQAADYQTRSHEGLGLGLSIVKKTALLHGGDATVESELGQGTTVTMTLKRYEPKPADDKLGSPQALDDELGRLHAQNIQYARDLAETYKARKQASIQLELTQNQLVRSDKLATMGQMAAGIAHEVSNMLNPILGLAYLLRQRLENLEPALNTMLVSIEESAQQAAVMLRQILDFSRKTPSQFSAVNVVPLLDRVLNLLAFKLRKGKVTVERDYGPGPVELVANGAQLEQVFSNLVINAVDAMEGGGQLTISLNQRPGSDDNVGLATVEIRIADTGSGIPEEVRESIFEPFFSTKEEGKGTGLGLFIAYGIIEKHGGVLEVESEVGVGTTFSINLPAQNSE